MAQQLNQYDNVAQELGFNIIAGTGTPADALATGSKKGTIYVQTDATSTTSRLWINTGTTWGYVSTSK